jgi:uncharacterized protein
VIFVDSNIPMYLVGAAHPNKGRASQLLNEFAMAGERLVTDAEVLQEILRRYASLARKDAIQPAFEALLGVVDAVFAIEVRDVLRAKDILLGSARLSARDALHAAVMQRMGARKVFSFDAGFDELPGIERLS